MVDEQVEVLARLTPCVPPGVPGGGADQEAAGGAVLPAAVRRGGGGGHRPGRHGQDRRPHPRPLHQLPWYHRTPPHSPTLVISLC